MLNMQSSQRFIRKSHGANAAGCNFGLAHTEREVEGKRERKRERESEGEREREGVERGLHRYKIPFMYIASSEYTVMHSNSQDKCSLGRHINDDMRCRDCMCVSACVGQTKRPI